MDAMGGGIPKLADIGDDGGEEFSVVRFPACWRWVVGFTVAACCFPADAQDAAKTYPVRGVVVNSLTHQPIARALVEEPSDSALTDNNGHFELELPAGTTQLIAQRPGYVQQSPGARVQVQVTAEMPEVTLSLTPQAVLSGHVDLSSSEAADGINIMVYRSVITMGVRTWMAVSSTRTNSAGDFRLTSLAAPGNYLLQSMPALDGEAAQRTKTAHYGFPMTAYPEGAAAGSAIALQAGQQVAVRMEIERQRFYPVSIAVEGSQAETSGGMQVEVRNAAGPPMDFPAQWSFQKHAISAELPNGHYYAALRSQLGKSSFYGRIDFSVEGAAVSGLIVKILPLQAVAVEVRRNFAPSQAGSGPGVEALVGPSGEVPIGLSLQMVDAGGGGANPGPLQHAPGANDQSQLEVARVEPGRYWVSATPFEGYVSELTSGGVDLTREPLVVGPGGSTAPIQIAVRNDGGQIAGTVRPQAGSGGSRIASALVFALPQFASAAPPLQTGTAIPGTFNFSGIAPGAYRVIAIDQYVDFSQMQPEVLERYTGNAQTVTVEAGGTATVEVDLQHMSAADGGDLE